MSFVICFAFSGSACLAQNQMCALEYDSGEAFKNGTPCTDAKAAYDGTKNLISLTCGASPVISLLFEQPSGQTVALAGYEAAFKYRATDFGAPACEYNPKGYFGNASPLIAECPRTDGDFEIIHGAIAIFDAGDFGSSPYPNLELIRVTFESWLGNDGATSTNAIDFTDAILTTQDSNEIQPQQVDADVICHSVCSAVSAPVNISASSGTPSCSGSPLSGTMSNIKINFTKPTQCDIGSGGLGPCGSVCTEPAVKVEKISPGGTEVIAEEATSSPVTDPNPRATGVQLTYRLTGVCKTGTASDSGACGGLTPPTITFIPECGSPPTISEQSLTVASKAVADSTACPPTYALQNLGISVKGAIEDSDSSYSQLSAALYYGTEDNDPPFPTAVSAAISSSKSFEAQIPSTAVRENTDIYWALWATDQVSLTGKYPADYDGTAATAKTIPGECISESGICLGCFPEPPYPNQFPFRAGHGENLVIGFKTPESAEVVMYIYDMDGRLVRQVGNSDADPYAFANICNWQFGCSWDGTDSASGGLVPNGMYIINLQGQGTGSNFSGQALNYTKGIVVMK